jgi:hypothetical protein
MTSSLAADSKEAVEFQQLASSIASWMMTKMHRKLYHQEDKRKSNKTNATNPASTE